MTILDPNMETVPEIRIGDYSYRMSMKKIVTITNAVGQEQQFSIDALRRMADSTGMPEYQRSMAQAALNWVEQNS